MILTIDNLDGLGAVDYSAAIAFAPGTPLRIVRSLNAPSTLFATLVLAGTTLPVPARRGRVIAADDAGLPLFTGYLATAPVALYAGAASAGAVYRYALEAVSDEWLLDKQTGSLRTGAALGASGGALLQALTAQVDASRFTSTGIAAGRTAGTLPAAAGGVWSTHAGSIADATYSSYRALDGALTLAELPGAVHVLSDADGSLELAGLKPAVARELANDVALAGALEAAAYWTELFHGDGTTATFTLTGEPAALNAARATLLDDSFTGADFDSTLWALSDAGSHLAVGAGGLLMTGGNGFDGQTSLTALALVELGGTLELTLDDVLLNPGSDGVLGGLYTGITARVHCLAGFNVRQSNGNTLVTPMLAGVETGASLTVLQGHAYTLRLRVHCPELERIRQTFYTLVDGAVQLFGGDLLPADAAVVFEVRDAGESSNTPVTVLYEGTVSNVVPSAKVAAVDSVQLFGSIGSVRLLRTGTVWMTSNDATTGTPRTLAMGAAGAGVACGFPSAATGNVTFFSGREPAPGELVTVGYRGRQRAIARAQDAASVAAEAAGGGVGLSRFVGRITRPVARTSKDCANAAAAVLSFSTQAAAAGIYTATRPAADFWPGDLIALTSNGSSVKALARRVTIEDFGAAPEALRYSVAYANDWAEALGLRVEGTLPADAVEPLSPVAVTPLGSLADLRVTSVTNSVLTCDTGVDAPAGGGFEVRRSDNGFGTGGSGLVLKSPVRGLSLPRGAFEETFFIRMYDGSVPPLYSRWSSALVTHIAVG